MNALTNDKIRENIARKVRELRRGRRWTQAEFSGRLGLSQSRLSEIERGDGSFTAEQFLVILKLFNVPVSHFVAAEKGIDAELQNALARLGAGHLQEDADVLPSGLLDQVADVVREVLVAADSPRHVTALAPVLVRNVERLSLPRLRLRLAEVGAERRLGWLVANILAALEHVRLTDLPRKEAQTYRRAKVVLGSFLDGWNPSDPGLGAPDILDHDILSARTLAEVRAANSTISQHWGIVTALQPTDFFEALEASRVGA